MTTTTLPNSLDINNLFINLRIGNRNTELKLELEKIRDSITNPDELKENILVSFVL